MRVDSSVMVISSFVLSDSHFSKGLISLKSPLRDHLVRKKNRPNPHIFFKSGYCAIILRARTSVLWVSLNSWASIFLVFDLYHYYEVH